MKWFRIIAFGLIITFSILTIINIYKIDRNLKIIFPKLAQHNTIGELPFVEAMDDGDFYEEDGDEGLTAQNCNRKISDQCEKECTIFGKIRHGCSAGCYLSRVGRCDALHEQQLYSSAAAGNFTAQWMVFMNDNCGSWACMGDDKRMEEVSQQFKEIKNEEWGDKMIWLGNQGIFEKGYMNYSRP